MGKIGRNQPCPCGSGKKYKHCCVALEQVRPQQSSIGQVKKTLMAEIELIQGAAQERREKFREMGVFLFFSNSNGDAWVLELTDQDAVQVAAEGRPLEVPVDENPETIEVNWSHRFSISNKQFYLTDYKDAAKIQLAAVPTQQINAAVRRGQKLYTPELLDQIHLRGDHSSA